MTAPLSPSRQAGRRPAAAALASRARRRVAVALALAWQALLLPGGASAQPGPAAMPEGAKAVESAAGPAPTVLAPVVPVAVDPDALRLVRPELDAAARTLAATFLGASARPMADLRPSAPLNAGRAARPYLGAPATPTPAFAGLLIQPVLCAAGGTLITAVEAIRLADGRLLAGAHVYQDNPLPQAQRTGAAGPYLARDAWALAATDLATKLKALAPGDAREDALNLGTHVARETQGSAHGALSCLTMLLSHQWAAQRAVATTVGQQSWAFATRFLGLATRPQRATRTLMAEWRLGPSWGAPPWRGSVAWRAAEGTLAQGIPPSFTDAVTVTGAQRRLTWAPMPGLDAFVAAEAASLRLTDAPRVVRKDRGWVYLDRGRAWGLKMDDRVIGEEGGVLIKGHVVGFYGPGAGLKDADGRPLREGAIVFVRKGQAEARPGLALRFDPTTYPTDWPPRPTP